MIATNTMKPSAAKSFCSSRRLCLIIVPNKLVVRCGSAKEHLCRRNASFISGHVKDLKVYNLSSLAILARQCIYVRSLGGD